MKRNGSGELVNLAKMLGGKFATVIQQVNYPMHKGLPNPAHGKFFFVGSIPVQCYDSERGGSKFYATEQDAINAAIAAGAEHIQGVDRATMAKHGPKEISTMSKITRLRTRARLLSLLRRSHATLRPTAADVREARLALSMARCDRKEEEK